MTPTPGDVLLHPVAVGAVAAMAFNDHWLKLHHAGMLSGKLSDVAGLVVLPLALLAAAEVASGRILGRRALVVCLTVSAVGYSLVEVASPFEWLWCWTWGGLQWPARAIAALVGGHSLPAVAPVTAWSDWTDLLVLPAAAIGWFAARGRWEG